MLKLTSKERAARRAPSNNANIRPACGQVEWQVRGQGKLYTLNDDTSPSATKGFYGKVFTFFHLCLIVGLDAGNGLPIDAAVDFVLRDRVSADVLDGFDWVE